MKDQDVKPKQKKVQEESMAISAARQVFLILFVGMFIAYMARWIVMRLSVSKDPLPEEIKVADIDLEIALDKNVEEIEESISAPGPQDEEQNFQQPHEGQGPPNISSPDGEKETIDITPDGNQNIEENKTQTEEPDRQYTWGPWSPWSQCSVTCDGGVRVRSRRCYHVTWSSPRIVAFDLCEGDAIEEDACVLSLCPNDKAEKPNGPRETICDDSDGGVTDGGDADYSEYQCPDADDFDDDMGEGEGDGGGYHDDAYMDGEKIGPDGDDVIEERIEASQARDTHTERGDQMDDDGPGDADADGDGIFEDADGDGIPDDVDADINDQIQDADGDGIADDIDDDGLHGDGDADGDGDHDGKDGDGNQWDEEKAEQDAKEEQRRMSVQEESRKDGEHGDDMDDDQDGDNADDDADNDQADDQDADDDIDDDDNEDQNQQRKRKNPEEEEEEEEEDKDEEEEQDKKKIKKKKKKKRRRKKKRRGSRSSSSSSDQDTLAGMSDVGSDIYTPGAIDTPDREHFPFFSLVPRSSKPEIPKLGLSYSQRNTTCLSSTSSSSYTSDSDSSSCDTSDYDPSDVSDSEEYETRIENDQTVPGPGSFSDVSKTSDAQVVPSIDVKIPKLIVPREKSRSSKRRKSGSRDRSHSLPLGLEAGIQAGIETKVEAQVNIKTPESSNNELSPHTATSHHANKNSQHIKPNGNGHHHHHHHHHGHHHHHHRHSSKKSSKSLSISPLADPQKTKTEVADTPDVTVSVSKVQVTVPELATASDISTPGVTTPDVSTPVSSTEGSTTPPLGKTAKRPSKLPKLKIPSKLRDFGLKIKRVKSTEEKEKPAVQGEQEVPEFKE